MDGTSPAEVAAAARAQATARRVHGVEPAEQHETSYIGLVTRVIAFAADAAVINTVALVVGVVVTLVFSVLPTSDERQKMVVAIGGVAFALWVIGYFTAFWTTTGQTPGNRMMQIKVLRLDGTHLKPRHAAMRLFGIVLSAPFLIGFLPILVTERRRGFHDWLARTVVIAAPREAGPRP